MSGREKRYAVRKDGKYVWDVNGDSSMDEINSGFVKRPVTVKQSSPSKFPKSPSKLPNASDVEYRENKKANGNSKKNSVFKGPRSSEIELEKQRLISIHLAETKRDSAIALANTKQAKAMATNEKRSAILQYNSEVKLANAITNLEKRKIVEENKKKAASAKSAVKRRHNNNEVRKAKYKSDRNSLGNNGTDEFVAVTSETSEGHTDSDINIDVKNFNEGYNNDSIFITCGCCGQELGYNEKMIKIFQKFNAKSRFQHYFK